MIQLHPIKRLQDLNPDFRQIYEDSFPEDERREWDQFADLFQKTEFAIFEIYDPTQFLGFIAVWNLHKFSFIEHFAIRSNLRNKGFGSNAMKKFLTENFHPVILETEDLQTEEAQKRISFYERLNFCAFNENYYQPAYSKEKKKVKMILMRYPKIKNPTDFETFKSEIHRTVYSHF
ncbi:MAG: GNAT family N-acetyltransferase [Prolixibacteraceae bacterium]|jgi:ribosomal protein S18 acetylase RimI-like enzyme